MTPPRCLLFRLQALHDDVEAQNDWLRAAFERFGDRTDEALYFTRQVDQRGRRIPDLVLFSPNPTTTRRRMEQSLRKGTLGNKLEVLDVTELAQKRVRGFSDARNARFTWATGRAWQAQSRAALAVSSAIAPDVILLCAQLLDLTLSALGFSRYERAQLAWRRLRWAGIPPGTPPRKGFQTDRELGPVWRALRDAAIPAFPAQWSARSVATRMDASAEVKARATELRDAFVALARMTPVKVLPVSTVESTVQFHLNRFGALKARAACAILGALTFHAGPRRHPRKVVLSAFAPGWHG